NDTNISALDVLVLIRADNIAVKAFDRPCMGKVECLPLRQPIDNIEEYDVAQPFQQTKVSHGPTDVTGSNQCYFLPCHFTILSLVMSTEDCGPRLDSVLRTFTSLLHMLNYRVAKTGAAHELGAGHQTLEIVSHRLLADGALQTLDDEVGRLSPTHVAKHHLARQNNRAGIHFVEIGILRRRAMGRLKNRMPAVIIDVRSRRDADPAHLCGQCVR